MQRFTTPPLFETETEPEGQRKSREDSNQESDKGRKSQMQEQTKSCNVRRGDREFKRTEQRDVMSCLTGTKKDSQRGLEWERAGRQAH